MKTNICLLGNEALIDEGVCGIPFGAVKGIVRSPDPLERRLERLAVTLEGFAYECQTSLCDADRLYSMELVDEGRSRAREYIPKLEGDRSVRSWNPRTRRFEGSEFWRWGRMDWASHTSFRPFIADTFPKAASLIALELRRLQDLLDSLKRRFPDALAR